METGNKTTIKIKKKLGKKKLVSKTNVDLDLNTVYANIETIDGIQNENQLNDFSLLKENDDRKTLIAPDNEFEYLYPNLEDPAFNVKIAERKEFNDTKYDGKIYADIENQSNILCNAEFELAPHQLFVRNFMSFQTPYNGLLLYHGLGSGKTCSAISVSEEMRDYLKQMGIVQRIIIVASPNVQDNFRLQLFDDRKLQLVDGVWNLRACTGNKFLKEINPMNMKGLSKERVMRQIVRIINNYYLFLGYVEFANYVSNKSQIESTIVGAKKRELVMRKNLNKHFGNRLIIIDEVHNIRMTDDNKDKRVAMELLRLVKNVENMRLLLLSATPMYNSYKEVIWLVNLLNLNDKRSTIETKDVFDTDGNFRISADGTEIGKELLERKATGYISFVRGENPYTFPYRIWPSEFDKSHTFEKIPQPRTQLNGMPVIQPLEKLSLYLANIGEYQQKGYNYIIDQLKSVAFDGVDANKTISFENMESFGYTLLQRPLEALNIIYPDKRLDAGTDTDAKIDIADLVGKNGLKRIMKYNETQTPPVRNKFEYINEATYGRIFSPSELGKYSGKIKSVCDSIINSTGVVLVYSQYIDGGLVPIALALEELGFTRAGSTTSLFKTKPVNQIDAITFKSQDTTTGKDFNAAQYVMITGDKALSPDNVADLKLLTNIDNKDGAKVKVVLISQAGSEGLDFKFIRQVHILEPWYNMNRIEQIIGRGVRTCSHKDLPFKQRNVQIYLYGSIMSDKTLEAADLYVYRLAELKAVQIGVVSRTLKEISVDCILNSEQIGFTVSEINQTVIQELSNKKLIKYAVGDRPYTSTCDYMSKCSYSCKPTKAITDNDIKLDTYSENFIMVNNEKIIQRIRNLMKERFFYKKLELISMINIIKVYPDIQINAALNQLVEDKNEFISDKYGRIGNLINIRSLYLFQPLELTDKNISTYDRSVPVEYKRQALNIEVPEKIDEVKAFKETSVIKPTKQTGMPTDDADAKVIIDNMRIKYDNATVNQEIVRGSGEWYKIAGVIINDMTNELDVSTETLLQLLVEHIVDELKFIEHVTLINYLYKQPIKTIQKDPLLTNVKKYYDSKIVTNKSKNISGIILQNNGKYEIIVASLKDKAPVWKMAEGEDKEDLSGEINGVIKRFFPADKRINEIVGFMDDFKNEYVVFKVKNLTELRNKGARCDQSPKGEALQLLNVIYDDKSLFTISEVKDKNKDNVITSLMSKNNTNDNIVLNYSINKNHICVIQEFVLRLFNYEKKNGKIWFLSPEESVIIDIKNIFVKS